MWLDDENRNEIVSIGIERLRIFCILTRFERMRQDAGRHFKAILKYGFCLNYKRMRLLHLRHQDVVFQVPC